MWRDCGIEIESALNPEQLESILQAASVDYARSENPATFDFEKWIVKPDMSCGSETCSPIIRSEDDLEDLRNILAMARYYCSAEEVQFVDARCGLHVHVDLSDFTVKQIQSLVRTMFVVEDRIYDLVDPSRRHNKFCMPLDRHALRTYVLAHNSNVKTLGSSIFKHLKKHHGFNLRAYSEKGTVEFRYHQSTIDFEEIVAYVRMSQEIVDFASRHGDPERYLDELNLPAAKTVGNCREPHVVESDKCIF